jgi:hypothetical protein
VDLLADPSAFEDFDPAPYFNGFGFVRSSSSPWSTSSAPADIRLAGTFVPRNPWFSPRPAPDPYGLGAIAAQSASQ